jgi:hypothetical protein
MVNFRARMTGDTPRPKFGSIAARVVKKCNLRKRETGT